MALIANKTGSFGHLGLPVYPDVIPGMGPLSGLYTAFEATGAGELLMIACDMPLVSREMVKFVLSCSDRPGSAVIPVVGGREQGLFAIYRRSSIEKFMERIKSASIQFDEFRRGLDKSHIEEDELRRVEADLRSFVNVNRPEDIAIG